MKNYSVIKVKSLVAFGLVGTLIFGGLSCLLGEETNKDYGNTMIMGVWVHADKPGHLDIEINSNSVLLKDNDVAGFLNEKIVAPETLVIEYTSGLYSEKSKKLIHQIKNLRKSSKKTEKTFFVNMGRVGGKHQSEVAISFTDKIGNGIKLGDLIIRNESEFTKAFESAEKLAVKRILWIPDDSELATQFTSALKTEKLIILTPDKDPVFSGLKIE